MQEKQVGNVGWQNCANMLALYLVTWYWQLPISGRLAGQDGAIQVYSKHSIEYGIYQRSLLFFPASQGLVGKLAFGDCFCQFKVGVAQFPGRGILLNNCLSQHADFLFNPVRHVVEGPGQNAHFVFGLNLGPAGQVALADGLSGGARDWMGLTKWRFINQANAPAASMANNNQPTMVMTLRIVKASTSYTSRSTTTISDWSLRGMVSTTTTAPWPDKPRWPPAWSGI